MSVLIRAYYQNMMGLGWAAGKAADLWGENQPPPPEANSYFFILIDHSWFRDQYLFHLVLFFRAAIIVANSYK